VHHLEEGERRQEEGVHLLVGEGLLVEVKHHLNYLHY